MIRTYFWNDRVLGRKYNFYKKIGIDVSLKFRVGNVGDIFNKDLVNYLYNDVAKNSSYSKNRILCVGSILHKARRGDVICGIGAKSEDILNLDDLKSSNIYGLRGPKTYELLKKNNINLSNVKFLYDPGLLVKFMYDFNDIEIKKNRVIFIPHYRERNLYNNIKGVDIVDVDNRPQDVLNEIYSSELVYTSSLHGLIFSHALGRPAILIRPQTEEPLFKYMDYYASINIPFPTIFNDLNEAMKSNKPTSPIEINVGREDFYFPDITYLKQTGIAK